MDQGEDNVPSGGWKRTVLKIGVVLVVLLVGMSLGHPWRFGRGGMSQSGSAAQADVHWYTCGMHPQVILQKPGLCPICHMDLVPLDPAKFAGGIEVNISPEITQDIGVRIAPVTEGPVFNVIRTVGAVDYDEQLVRDVTTKYAGWIEKLYVDYTGQPVSKGQSLFDIYSPELYAAQEEYLQAIRPAGAAGPDKWGSDLREATRKRLEYLDMTPEQIDALAKAGKASRTTRILSRVDGLVINKNVLEGMKIDAGTLLYRIADMSKVWVMAAIYEYQLPYVQIGQEATVELSYYPGQKYRGKVSYIYPYLNPELRQVKLRLEFENPDPMRPILKPGMYANVEIRSKLADNRILVPREAIIDTGQRQIAIVSLGGGRFEPRTVRLGVQAENDMVEVLQGLKLPDKVVTSGQFLLDSEARLRENLIKMIQAGLASTQPATEPPAARTGPAQEALPNELRKPIVKILQLYLQIGRKLSEDSIEGISAPAGKIADEAHAMRQINVLANANFWQRHPEANDIQARATELAKAGKIEQARTAFAGLSISLAGLLLKTGVPSEIGAEIQELHCPMYRQDQGGSYWLQKAEEVRNPFYGSQMLGCFDEKKTLPVSPAPGGATATAPATKPAE